MLQTNFNVKESLFHFLKNFNVYGFKDKNPMLQTDIGHSNKKIELERLKESADLYYEIYSEDDELKGLTETSLP